MDQIMHSIRGMRDRAAVRDKDLNRIASLLDLNSSASIGAVLDRIGDLLHSTAVGQREDLWSALGVKTQSEAMSRIRYMSDRLESIKQIVS